MAVNKAGQNILRSDLSNASKLWRRYLQKDSKCSLDRTPSPEELEIDNIRRLNLATSILRPHVGKNIDVFLPDGSTALQRILANPEAMRLVTERNSAIRDTGNRYVHTLPPLNIVRESLSSSHLPHLSASDLSGMLGIIDFLEKMPPHATQLQQSAGHPRTSSSFLAPELSATSPTTALTTTTATATSAPAAQKTTSWAQVVAKPPATATSTLSTFLPPTSRPGAPSPKSPASQQSLSQPTFPSTLPPLKQAPQVAQSTTRVQPLSSTRAPQATSSNRKV